MLQALDQELVSQQPDPVMFASLAGSPLQCLPLCTTVQMGLTLFGKGWDMYSTAFQITTIRLTLITAEVGQPKR